MARKCRKCEILIHKPAYFYCLKCFKVVKWDKLSAKKQNLVLTTSYGKRAIQLFILWLIAPIIGLLLPHLSVVLYTFGIIMTIRYFAWVELYGAFKGYYPPIGGNVFIMQLFFLYAAPAAVLYVVISRGLGKISRGLEEFFKLWSF